MFHGFYNLASGMLYQSRNLNVISNNMVNVSTPGYKSDRMVSTTFKEQMLYRNGNRDKSSPAEMGTVSMIRAARDTEVSYEQGGLEETGGNLDFGLSSPGFFVIETPQGNLYTRNGSFGLDEEGYLSLGSSGRVLGTSGPIQLTTDRITVDESGNIYEAPLEGLKTEDGNEEDKEPALLGKLQVVDFADYDQLVKADNGGFTTQQEGVVVEQPTVNWHSIERANIDPIEEMTAMMSGQRASQSAAQMLKMYDQLMGKIVGEIGRV